MSAEGHTSDASHRKGLGAGTLAFLCWGVFPFYWRALAWVPAGQLLLFRVLCCIPVLLVLVAMKGQWQALCTHLRDRHILAWHGITALLLGINWWSFIWATHHQRIMEASLGYFITPLANVALGALVLKEKLRPPQWLAVGLAGLGVLGMMLLTGSLPWVALVVCSTFALYGLLRKRSPLDSLLGLTVESLVALPIALLALTQFAWPVAPHPLQDWGILGLSGIITTVPLLAFATAARSLPLTTIAQLQFLAPSLQFLIGLACGEAMNSGKLISFVIIWTAVAVYLWAGRPRNQVASQA
jgi:chloramphenicol-sensitive protein RarD